MLPKTNWNTWLLAVAISLVLGVCWQVSQVAPEIATLIKRAREDKVSEIEFPPWTWQGKVLKYKCVRESGESPSTFASRAAAEYAAMQEQFPPDNEDH